ncbi:MAG: P-loop NTPase [Neomegalonema sp.]|nr:P-loop NTPase [Neomegalonema sp.]
MSLIDKSTELLAAQRKGREQSERLRRKKELPFASAPIDEPDPETADQTSIEFQIDFKRLRKWGFLTPETRRSRTAEEFRLIKRRLIQRMQLNQMREGNGRFPKGRVSGITAGARGREHVILVTSAKPDEGKSFFATNLALSIVLDEGFNVLLGDADVIRPSLAQILGFKGRPPGLTDLLRDGGPSMFEVMHREADLPLSFLSAGTSVSSATDLFGGVNMASLVDDVAQRYTDRVIIFDAPPLLASTEPVALAQHVGQIVLVVDAENTPRSAVEAALDLLEPEAKVSLVLNNTTMKSKLEQFGSYYDLYNAR